MRAIYFDCFAGISGDMTLGALVDAGAGLKKIRTALKTLPVSGYTISSRREQRSHITGTRVNIRISKSCTQPDRRLSTILRLIERSGISRRAREHAAGIFKLVGRAEALIHDVPIEKVHFHEIGAVDSIVDIVGVAVAVDLLDIGTFHSAPVPLGTGFVNISHGRIPVPVPATVKILEGANVYTTGEEGEKVTPTGAGILKYFCTDFSGKINMKVESVGYGVGARDSEHCPSLLRVLIGEVEENYLETTMEVIETNIDDMSPMFYDAVLEKLFTAGALDAFVTPLHMKKNRPGCLLTVLTGKLLVNKLAGIIFNETTTLGLRTYTVRKSSLKREMTEVMTKYGKVRVKVGMLGGLRKFGPEYDDCKALSIKTKTPTQTIYDEALRLAKGR